MAVLGGVILDRFGIRRTGFMFVGFMAIGALLTAYGSSTVYGQGGPLYAFMGSFMPTWSPELKMMLLGRFFFGLGAETSIVVISRILVKWFKGHNLALAFGLKVGFGRLGTLLALNVSPIISQEGKHLNSAIWLGAVLVLTGFLAFVVYMFYDAKFDKQTQQKQSTSTEKFSFNDIRQIITNPAFIAIALLCVTFYSAVFPFMAYASDFFNDKFGLNSVESGRMTSVIPLATAIFTPLFGIFIDRIGRSSIVMLLGSIAIVAIHLTMGFTMLNPIIPMLLLGVAFSAVPGAMWPSMVKLVQERQIGTAYGIMYSIQNLGLWAFPLLAGYLLDFYNPGNPNILNYRPVMIMFALLGFIGLLFAIMLRIIDKRHNFGIDEPLNKKRP